MTIDIYGKERNPMAKKEKVVKEVLKFEAIRPFGPTIVKGKMPDSIVKLLDDKASEMFEDKEYAKKFDHAPHLAGNVKQETRYDPEWLGSPDAQPMIHLMGEMVKSYLSIPPASETISPEFVGQMIIESMWAVSQ